MKSTTRPLPAPVSGLFQDIVVVDTGSTDGTRAVAQSFGARVFDFPWPDSFGAARNESLRHAREQGFRGWMPTTGWMTRIAVSWKPC